MTIKWHILIVWNLYFGIKGRNNDIELTEFFKVFKGKNNRIDYPKNLFTIVHIGCESIKILSFYPAMPIKQ